jgi:hypothetical protein
MNGRSLRLGEALATGWRGMWRHPGPAIGGFALYVLMCVGMGWVPCLGHIAQIVILPPLVGGLAVLALKVVDDRDPKVVDLFEGFHAFGKWMGIYWLYYVIVIAALVPLGILALTGYFVLWENAGSPSEAVVIAVSGVLAFAAVAVVAVMVALLIRWTFVFYAGVETADTMGAFAISGELTKGRRLQLLWMGIALGIISGAGVLALIVGVFVTAPLSTYAMAALYRQVNPLPEVTAPEEPPAVWPPRPDEPPIAWPGVAPPEMPGGSATEVRDADDADEPR